MGIRDYNTTDWLIRPRIATTATGQVTISDQSGNVAPRAPFVVADAICHPSPSVNVIFGATSLMQAFLCLWPRLYLQMADLVLSVPPITGRDHSSSQSERLACSRFKVLNGMR